MSINLSEDAVHALNRSAAAAARDGEEAVAPIHVLAGCLSEKDGTLVDALKGIGLATEDLPSELLDLPRTYEGHLPFTPESHDALAAAVEFGESRDGATTSAHLLLGVARTRPPDCSELLDGWGLEPEALAEQLARRAEQPGGPAGRPGSRAEAEAGSARASEASGGRQPATTPQAAAAAMAGSAQAPSLGAG